MVRQISLVLATTLWVSVGGDKLHNEHSHHSTLCTIKFQNSQYSSSHDGSIGSQVSPALLGDTKITSYKIFFGFHLMCRV